MPLGPIQVHGESVLAPNETAPIPIPPPSDTRRDGVYYVGRTDAAGARTTTEETVKNGQLLGKKLVDASFGSTIVGEDERGMSKFEPCLASFGPGVHWRSHCALAHHLIYEALGEAESSNLHVDDIQTIVAKLPPEWMISRRDLRRYLFARKLYRELKLAEAEHVPIDTVRYLAKTGKRLTPDVMGLTFTPQETAP